MKIALTFFVNKKPIQTADVSLDVDIYINRRLKTLTANGKQLLSRDGMQEPIHLKFSQSLGNDRTLFKLDQLPNFGMKVTYSRDVVEDDQAAEREFLEVTFADLVSDNLSIGDRVSIDVATLTMPKIEWLEEAAEAGAQDADVQDAA